MEARLTVDDFSTEDPDEPDDDGEPAEPHEEFHRPAPRLGRWLLVPEVPQDARRAA